MIGVDKVVVLAEAIGSWRDHWQDATDALAAARRIRVKSREDRRNQTVWIEGAKVRRSTALACLAASLLLHDRAVIEQTARRQKVKSDFEKAGMFLPGFRYQWIGDRPIAIPLDSPLVTKNPFGMLNPNGAV